ncbi:class I SAM-dependent methyltransferase [Fulvivirga sp. 29W222]|uniref:Class I SAM-dependent methyltransferase n=1 Tax=Fulvivirga marina TaxID=2494733 RepID=A0A937FUM5_9BACT|nr:class I SAM-dependent methyltransferase [Fulvivirga marina]MBL6445303.1 class I SAM-dependent methyltransferase [Fulvivirga marina]
MESTWLKHWDERYRKEEYAYGKQPNHYLKEQLAELEAGSILFPAEGEGRNAVYAACQGWNVDAFDISKEGRNKALLLAEKNNVTINYQVGELPDLNYDVGQFDAIALIYAHFPAHLKSAYHKLLDKYLVKGGVIIFEAFSKKHLEYRLKNEKVGGPRDLESLFSIEELRSDFANYEVLELEEKEVELNEGLYHNGKSSVIRFVGKKM